MRVQLALGVSTQLLQGLSGLAQKTMDPNEHTTETMDPNPKNNRAAPYTDLTELEVVKRAEWYLRIGFDFPCDSLK